MKFSTREDIEAPADYVFARISDIAAFERRALRVGADVRRIGDGPVGPGAEWQVDFKFRGKDRHLTAKLVTFDVPNALQVDGRIGGLESVLLVDVVSLSRTKTRIAVSLDMRANTLTARLLLQSLKLNKTRLTKRFKGRVLDFTEDIEDDHRRSL